MTAEVVLMFRSRHDLCETSREHEPCDYCGAPKGAPCADYEPGVHLRRCAEAHRDWWMSNPEFASLLPDVFSPATLVLDPGDVPMDPPPPTAGQFLAAMLGVCRHPGQIRPGQPVLLEPHTVGRREHVGEELAVTVDGTRAPLAGELIIVDWHDDRGRLGSTVYRRDDYIRLRRPA